MKLYLIIDNIPTCRPNNKIGMYNIFRNFSAMHNGTHTYKIYFKLQILYFQFHKKNQLILHNIIN